MAPAVALDALAAGASGKDKDFYEGKVAAAQFYARQVLPRLSAERAMAEELLLTINEMRAGIPTAEAFRKLSARVGLEEMHMPCSVIIQSSTLGASIGQMLRQYAASWRQQRMMALEEKAGKMTAALTLPLTLCRLPAAIRAMRGPAVIVVMQNLG